LFTIDPLSEVAMRTFLSLVTCVALFAFTAACGDDKKSGNTPEAAHEHPPGPHDGEVLELGQEDAHVEMIHDAAGGNVTFYVLGPDMSTPILVEAPVVSLKAKSGTVQVTLTAVNAGADGRADTWKGSHEALKAEPLDGSIKVKIGDKSFSSPLEAEPHVHK
jgi:hypothetical protein